VCGVVLLIDVLGKGGGGSWFGVGVVERGKLGARAIRSDSVRLLRFGKTRSEESS